MEENQALKPENGDSGEDFYEMIQAPKFVDFTLSNHYIPDDRYWFCSRVGCEEKHPEEMDSEIVDKNFRMRVMAARSPNVRLQRAQRNLKCPLTAPPKSRVARLALISSIVEAKVKSKPSTKLNAMPKQAHVKEMTTPRNRKPNSNTNAFLSVKNPKAISADELTKTTMVAKALVFQSPEKDIKKTNATKTNIPMKSLCSAMKNVEITNAKKNVLGDGHSLPSNAPRKNFRGREVKSRVFDSLGTHNCKRQAVKSVRVLKRRSKEKKLRPPLHDHVAQEVCNEDNIDDKSKHVSVQSLSTSAKSNEGNQDELSRAEDSDNLSKHTNETSISNSEETERVSEKSELEDQKYEQNSNEEIAKTGAIKKNIPRLLESDDKENKVSVNNENVMNSEYEIEHENIAPNDNRGNSQSARAPFGKIENSKTTVKVKGILKKTLKENTTPAAVDGSHGMKTSRPKATNPKPFRLRTDERVVLREANLGKKLICPLSDITASRRFCGEKSQRKNQVMNHGGTVPDSKEGDSMNSKKCVALEHQKLSHYRQLEPDKERTTKKADDNPKRTKQEKMPQKVMKPCRDLSSREEKTSLVPSRQLIARKETSLCILGNKDTKKRPSENALSRRRPVIIAKEPNLQCSHVPRRAAREKWI